MRHLIFYASKKHPFLFYAFEGRGGAKMASISGRSADRDVCLKNNVAFMRRSKKLLNFFKIVSSSWGDFYETYTYKILYGIVLKVILTNRRWYYGETAV